MNTSRHFNTNIPTLKGFQSRLFQSASATFALPQGAAICSFNDLSQFKSAHGTAQSAPSIDLSSCWFIGSEAPIMWLQVIITKSKSNGNLVGLYAGWFV
ncbi:hypothetical protein SeLEV6574_g05633 [Synchytrium endobioticum]|uniref:Uncharacterized protein n=1 Tax=Synchytrium endobioticum TaxID=286115 RepID=A0A507CTH6_9FUNG|nr:hypothetical protein SeLEV6574_g05633 [Synchytrium endobioticum]